MITVKHNAEILVGDYQFVDKVKSEVLSLLKTCNPIPTDHSNVKASIHTEWYWERDNITFKNLQSYIISEIERYFRL